VTPGAAGCESADGCRDGLRPGLQLAEVAGGDHHSALEGGEPQAADQELAADDRRHHPRREYVLVEQDDERGEHEQLVGHRIEERAERRGPAGPSRDPAVEPVGRHRSAEDGGRPVVVTVEVDGEKEHDERGGGRADDRQLIGEGDGQGRIRIVFSKVLVANRGEIAVRIFRTLRELGVGSVAVYSDVDRGSVHARYADEAFALGGRTAAESYLAVDRILEAARKAGAEAIHPGYGFLAENASFARAVEDAGLVWVGPPAAAIELMGVKTAARKRMQAAGIPVVPGSEGPVTSVDEVIAQGERVGYPLVIKAAAGGGGKGMKLVASPLEVASAFDSARREGRAYFGDDSVYVERYLEDPRHVEVQVLADTYGSVIHLGERDCTIQRRHQKLVEETPSPAVSPELRAHIGQIAVNAARAVGYRSAGTIEGLLGPEGEYFFMEMNTRIQVEHTITELVTGLDLVREQILIAAGEPLWLRQEDVVLRGHAIECRINAEDPSTGFLPTPGRITSYREPSGPGIRVDSGVTAGSEVSELYDPMMAKLVVHDVDRERARRRMLRALGEFEIGGVKTLVGFHRALLSHPCFAAGTTCHGVVESEELAKRAEEFSHQTTETLAAAPDGVLTTSAALVEVDGRRVELRISHPEPAYRALARRRKERRAGRGPGGAADAVVSPMQGTVLEVGVADGDEVEAGAVICIVEAMKMENEVSAHRAGVVSALSVEPGGPVAIGQVICVISSDGSGPEPDPPETGEDG
jgi:acetyl-CoA/propionyl-CoA carboxylase biotin carboxyl carrier protein